MIGMVLLRPGWERDYEGRPPVYPVGCSGVITHAERLPDGRYNIVLRGLEKFRIVERGHAQHATASRDVEPIARAAGGRTTAPSIRASGGASRRCSCRSRRAARRGPHRCRRRCPTRIW